MNNESIFLRVIEQALHQEMISQIVVIMNEINSPIDLSAIGQEHQIGYKAGHREACRQIESKLRDSWDEQSVERARRVSACMSACADISTEILEAMPMYKAEDVINLV